MNHKAIGKMNGEIPIEVMILGYNCKDDVIDCLSSLQNIEYEAYSVTYLDNASEDGTVDAVRSAFPDVRIVEYDENYGFPEGYDRAIEATDSKYVALLNPDTIVPSDWLSSYADIIGEESNDIVAWAGRIDILNSEKVHFTGGKITPMGSGIEPDVWKEKENVDDRDKKWTANGCGANMVVNAEKFVDIGGFDRSFFMYFEDVDFGWRAWLQGYKIRYVPDARIEHRFGGVVGSQSPFESEFRAFYGTRNRKLTLLKNASKQRLLFGIPISLIYDCVFLTLAALAGEIKVIKEVLRANMSVIKSLPTTIQKRRSIQSDRKRSETQLAKYGIFAGFRESVQFFFRLRDAV